MTSADVFREAEPIHQIDQKKPQLRARGNKQFLSCLTGLQIIFIVSAEIRVQIVLLLCDNQKTEALRHTDAITAMAIK